MDYSHIVLKKLDERLREDKQEIINRLATGLLSTFEDYKYQCGYLNGVNQSINLLQEIATEVAKIG